MIRLRQIVYRWFEEIEKYITATLVGSHFKEDLVNENFKLLVRETADRARRLQPN